MPFTTPQPQPTAQPTALSLPTTALPLILLSGASPADLHHRQTLLARQLARSSSLPRATFLQLHHQAAQSYALYPFRGYQRLDATVILLDDSASAEKTLPRTKACRNLHQAMAASVGGPPPQAKKLTRHVSAPSVVQQQQQLPPTTAAATTAPPPVYLLFPGLGCDWAGMGRDLLPFPPFRQALLQCHEILAAIEPGLDLLSLLAKEQPVSSSAPVLFSAIVAIELALTDLLHATGLQPAGMLGHSLGETACAYACGLLTREQALRVAHAQGQAAATIPGSMLAVGLSAKLTTHSLPYPGLAIVAENGSQAVTLGGDAATIAKARDHLKAQGLSAVEVQTANTLCHDPQRFQPAVSGLLAKLDDIVGPVRRQRPQTWSSTSLSDEAGKPRTAPPPFDAAYLCRTMSKPVLFRQALRHIPANAQVVEVGPSAIFSPLVQQERPDLLLQPIKLMSRSQPAVSLLAMSLGELYQRGCIAAPPLDWLLPVEVQKAEEEEYFLAADKSSDSLAESGFSSDGTLSERSGSPEA